MTSTTYIHPRAYSRQTYEVDAMLVRDNKTGTIHTIHGPKVYVWLGVKGATLVGYNARTGRYTQRVKHLNKCSFLGFFLGTEWHGWEVEANTIDK